MATQDRETNGNNNEKLVLVDKSNYEVSKRFWAFAQYSRHIRPGARRVDISAAAATPGLRTTAFVNADGSVVVVAVNTGAAAAQLTVAGVKSKSAAAYVTDAANDMANVAPVTVWPDGTAAEIKLPARAVVTVVILQ